MSLTRHPLAWYARRKYHLLYMKTLNVVIEQLLPEYRVRHIFAAKLRIVAFLGFWAIYLYFFRDVLGQTKWIAVTVFACFLITGFAYGNVMRGRLLLVSFALELVSDLVAIATVLYATGGPHSPYYTIYLFYVFTAGILYSYKLAAVTSFAAIVTYAVFLILCNAGIIPPLILEYGEYLPIPTYTPLAHFLFALIFLIGIVYTVKVANYFSQQRERALEKRNRELTALHRMSSTIRSARALRNVVDQLLSGILDGLDFETALLIQFDWVEQSATLYAPRTHKLERIETLLGRSIEGVSLPIDALPPAIMNDVMRQRIIFRRYLAELASGFSSFITPHQCNQIQDELCARRIVVMPIVVEREVLGVLIGFSREAFIEEEQVATFEAFANQSALSLEAAALIDRLRRVNEALTEANRVKSEFLATMSHELRTPLTAIIGFSELLMEGVMGDLEEEQKESLKEVLHNAADLLDLINSLLDLTKIESGKMRLEMRTFDIGETLRRVTATITPLVQKKGQLLSFSAPSFVPSMYGDERKIQQMLLNLLANANKFTPEGGRIQIDVRHFKSWEEMEDAGKWIERIIDNKYAFKNGGVEIVIADDGIGISPDQMDKIFEMFHQVDGSTTRSFGGTGVGLALARKFVEMHGGRIWVESELGKGARFTAIMPLSLATTSVDDEKIGIDE